MSSQLTIITGGQTGVDRGALRGALDAGFVVDGYMPMNACDEMGLIPKDIAKHLRRCPVPGLASRTMANVEMSSALLIIVPDCDHVMATPGTRMTWTAARDLARPRLAIDPTHTDDRLLEHFVSRLFVDHATQLMVAGPRASKWANGEYEAAAVLRRLGLKLAIQKDSARL